MPNPQELIALAEIAAEDMLADIIGPPWSQTTQRVAEDHFKQFARKLLVTEGNRQMSTLPRCVKCGAFEGFPHRPPCPVEEQITIAMCGRPSPAQASTDDVTTDKGDAEDEITRLKTKLTAAQERVAELEEGAEQRIRDYLQDHTGFVTEDDEGVLSACYGGHWIPLYPARIARAALNKDKSDE